jgi:hypothetical protein
VDPRQAPVDYPGPGPTMPSQMVPPPPGYKWEAVPIKVAGEDQVRFILTPIVPEGPPKPPGGGGGGGGGGVTPPAAPDVVPLGELSWWANADMIQPLLRGWAGWLKESVERTRMTQPIPQPFAFDEEAEAVAAEIPADRGPTMPGYKSSADVLRRLQKLMGLTFEPEEDATAQWQKVINAIPKADFEAQQLWASLRYDPQASQWYSVDIGQLVHPEHL